MPTVVCGHRKKWISLGKNVIEKSMGYGAVTGPEAKDYL
jgi:hypothetical protein